MIDPLKLYHALPYPLRVIAASMRGYYLRYWRYGPETERLVEEALEREKWKPDEWKNWQEQKLTYILERAARQVPYYRQQWAARQRAGDRASAAYLENWPLLGKDALREKPHAFLVDGADHRRMFIEHTSGTTGKPLNIWFSKYTLRTYYALFEARWRRWYGLSIHDRWAILGGQLVAPTKRQKPQFWVWNAGLNQLYLSSYHLAPENAHSYVSAIENHRIVYLYGYASSLYSLANFLLESNLSPPPIKAAISNAEPLYLHQRESIAKAFNCPVYDTYGLSEFVCAASECIKGRLHLWPEVGYTEILSDKTDEPAGYDNPGRIVATGLINADMPLIRYVVGDRGSLVDQAMTCGCGRKMPILGSIEGRLDDVIITPDGRRVGRLDPVFKIDLPIKEAQIIQETRQRIRVKYVPARGYKNTHSDLILSRLRDRLGDMEIKFEPVESIPRTSNGKFRAVISMLSGSENQHSGNK